MQNKASLVTPSESELEEEINTELKNIKEECKRLEFIRSECEVIEDLQDKILDWSNNVMQSKEDCPDLKVCIQSYVCLLLLLNLVTIDFF